MGQQSRARQATRYGSARGFGLDDRIAGGAGALGTYDTDHLERGRDVLEDLGDVFTQRLERTATGRARVHFRGMGLRLTRQVVRQRASTGA